MRVFVYGTLKRGHSNHDCLRGQQFIAEAVTQPRYRLHDLGGYPGMVLDELEDTAGGEYAREAVPLQPPFDQQKIEGYRYLRDVSAARDIGSRWLGR